jgi:hypothetical protein
MLHNLPLLNISRLLHILESKCWTTSGVDPYPEELLPNCLWRLNLTFSTRPLLTGQFHNEFVLFHGLLTLKTFITSSPR